VTDQTNAAVIDRLVEAYNAGDMEGFIDCFAPDARIYRFPDTLLHDGLSAIRTQYRAPLEQEYRTEVSERIVVGGHVVERERVTRPGGEPTEYLTIYTIADGRITRVDFLGAEAVAPT
jgi:putative hydrolase of HD superfamily